MRSRGFLSFVAAAIATWLIAIVPALAAPLAMNHTQWGVLVGAPTQINALAQGRDGFLWLGTSSGLYRFDGQTFEHVPRIPGDTVRAMQVTALLAAANGDIWAGYDYGGLAVYRNGRLIDANHGPPTGRVRKIAQAPDGAIWVLTNGLVTPGVSRFANGRWETIDTDRGLANVSTFDLVLEADGSVLAAQGDGIRRLTAGSRKFELLTRGPGKQTSLARDRDGTQWIADNQGIRRLGAAGSPPGKPWSPAHVLAEHQIYADRDGTIWLLIHGAGVARIAKPGDLPSTPVEMFTPADGLTSSVPLSFLQDAEGTIWIGTLNGLDRFRPSIFHPAKGIIPDSDWSFEIMPGPRSGLLLASQTGVFTLEPDQAPQRILKPSTTWNPGLCGTPDNFIVSDETRLISIRPDGRTEIEAPKLESEQVLNQCAVDRQGRLWVGVLHGGLFVRENGHWRKFTVFTDRPDWPFAMTTDRQGRVLLTYPLRALVRIDGDHVEQLLTGPPTPIGFIKGIQDTDFGLLVGGDQGLALVRGTQVKTLSAEAYPWLRDTTGITIRDGQAYLIAGNGVARLAVQDLRAAFDQPGRVLRPQLFAISDGLPGMQQRYGTTDILFDRSGLLWVATSQGIAWAHPKDLMAHRAEIPVVIRVLKTEHGLYRDPSHVTLPAGTRNVEIDFAPLAVSAPESARLRYRLVGTEGWTEAGERRQTTYTNLKNGTFRFELASANADGVWSEHPTILEFTIPPTFLQSRLFIVLCIVTVVVLLALLYNLRLRFVSNRIRDRMRLQLSERERIAQDLHDTLLQSIQGLIIRFHGLSIQPNLSQDTRSLINETLDQAEAALVESREQVAGLRSARVIGLHRRIEEAAAKLTVEKPPITVTTTGEERLLDPIVAGEAAKIAGEAIYNAVQHAQATRIGVTIAYLPDELVVRIVDDGRGIDAEILASGGREGHFGLRGMTERAHYVSGELTIASAAKQGTQVTLRVPARHAYRPQERRAFWPWRRKPRD